MDWKLFFTVFLTIFLAEIGDKTQLAAMAYSANSDKTWVIAAAVVVGLSLAGLLGVVLGRWLGGFLSPRYIGLVSGLMFVGIGCFILFQSQFAGK
ncbi:MAG: TMEM165/GDT1 family protein [Oligoflexus sp.]